MLSFSKHSNTRTQWFWEKLENHSTLVTTWGTSTMATFGRKAINLDLEHEWKQVAKMVEWLRYPSKVNKIKHGRSLFEIHVWLE
jgi:hypothetical protein